MIHPKTQNFSTFKIDSRELVSESKLEFGGLRRFPNQMATAGNNIMVYEVTYSAGLIYF